MVRVHPHVAIAMTAPMFEATAGIELQLGQGAFGASRAGLALPFWDELVGDEDVDDLLVGGSQELMKRPFPLDLVLALSTRTHSTILTNILDTLPSSGFLGSGSLLDRSELALLWHDVVDNALAHSCPLE